MKLGVLKTGNGKGRIGSGGMTVECSIPSGSWVVEDAGESVGLEVDGGGVVEVI